MHRRALVLGAWAVALLLGSVPPAVAQDTPAPPLAEAPAAEAPAVEPVAAAEAPAAAPPAAEPTPAPAGEQSVVEPAAALAAAPARRARPAGPAKGAPAVSATHRPRKGVVRSRPRPAPNMSQADADVSEFDGRVTIDRVQTLECGGGSCETNLTNFDVVGLEVRAEAGAEALIDVAIATVKGDVGDRTVTARVTLRAPGAPSSSGEVTLAAGTDLLRQDVFAGTPLEDAYASLFTAPVFRPGGALERLTIVFGDGNVVGGAFAAVSISAAGRRITVRVPVTFADEMYSPAGPLEVERGTADSHAPNPKRAAELRRENAPAGGVLGSGGGGGRDAVETPPADESAEPEDEGGGGLFGTIISTCVLGVGACGGDDGEDEEAVRFVVDSRSITIAIDDEGRGTIEIGCPSGFEGVSGTALVRSAIQLRVRPRDLSRTAEFTCDGGIIRVEVRLLDAELDRLRDAQGPIAARVAVRVTGEDGVSAVDFDVVTLELAADG